MLVLIAAVQFALHLWTNAHDNIFRDEMYYLAAGQNLDFGYVEFPPFVALVAAFSRALFGDSVFAIRLLPALAAAVIVLLTANMAAILGGGWQRRRWRRWRSRLARCSSGPAACSPWIHSTSCGGLY